MNAVILSLYLRAAVQCITSSIVRRYILQMENLLIQIITGLIAGLLVQPGKKAIDYSLEQIGRARFAGIKLILRNPIAFLAITRRVDFVGREVEKEEILSAMNDIGQTRVLFFIGEGGLGKTRLLEETGKLIKQTRQEGSIRWTGVIDLYHVDLREGTSVNNRIIERLDPEGNYFKNYRDAQSRYDKKQAAGVMELDAERKELDSIFVADYNLLAADYRLVITFDTIESLLYEEDLIHSILPDLKTSDATGNWILQQVSSLNNSVVLMAGRPSCKPFAEKLQEDLIKNRRTKCWLRELSSFSPLESREYLQGILGKEKIIREQIHEINSWIYQYATGNPVLMALVVELGLILSQDIVSSPADVYPTDLWRAIVKRLFESDKEEQSLLFLLALTRRGLDIELLHYLQPQWDLEQCEQLLSDVKLKSIVKTRENKPELFLHDSLYEAFDVVYENTRTLTQWYERLVDYYTQQRYDVNPLEPLDEIILKILYYSLQVDPQQAFEDVYLQYSEQAIKGHALSMDILLRDELFRFIRSAKSRLSHSSLPNLDVSSVQQDDVVRWIKRLVMHSKHAEAKRVAESIISYSPQRIRRQLDTWVGNQTPTSEQTDWVSSLNLSDASDFFWGHLMASYGEVLTYTDTPEIGQATLLVARKYLDEIKNDQTWFYNRIKGRVLNNLGYWYWSTGDFNNALKSFDSALMLFDARSSADEKADTYNNVAFVYGLLGAIDHANENIKEAIDIRRQLGQDYAIALSLNTRGLIKALKGDYETAPQDSLIALEIFEDLSASRGKGLALNAMGFILRQKGNRFTQLKQFDKAITAFVEARDYLLQSIELFGEVEEPLRLWEAYDELGCVYRDWGMCITSNSSHYNNIDNDAFINAKDALNNAWQLATEHNLRLQIADTSDDISVLYWAQSKIEEAQIWADRTIEYVPADFKTMPHSSHVSASNDGHAYWLILGKAMLNQARCIVTYSTFCGSDIINVIELCAYSAYCFHKFWPDTPVLIGRYDQLADIVKQTKVKFDYAHSIVSQWANDNGINILEFLKTLQTAYDLS